MNSVAAVGFDENLQPRFGSRFGSRQLVTRKVAAAILGVDIKTLQAMREQRKIPYVLTDSGEYRYREMDLEAFLTRTRASDPNALFEAHADFPMRMSGSWSDGRDR